MHIASGNYFNAYSNTNLINSSTFYQRSNQTVVPYCYLVAKLEDLSPCIFHVRIIPDSAPMSLISSLPTQQEILTLLLLNAPMLPKSVIKQMRDLLMHLEAIAPST